MVIGKMEWRLVRVKPKSKILTRLRTRLFRLLKIPKRTIRTADPRQLQKANQETIKPHPVKMLSIRPVIRTSPLEKKDRIATTQISRPTTMRRMASKLPRMEINLQI